MFSKFIAWSGSNSLKGRFWSLMFGTLDLGRKTSKESDLRLESIIKLCSTFEIYIYKESQDPETVSYPKAFFVLMLIPSLICRLPGAVWQRYFDQTSAADLNCFLSFDFFFFFIKTMIHQNQTFLILLLLAVSLRASTLFFQQEQFSGLIFSDLL